MKSDAFSDCHPAVNFLFFAAVICFSATVQHPAFVAASVLGGLVYYLLLMGRSGLRLTAVALVFWALIAGINPLLNTYGRTVLFTVFSRKYTWEALCYGAALGGIFAAMLLWFGCYSLVLTSDKFTALFGNLIPALSLLLVMVLRMIPAFRRKAVQILDERRCIGKGLGGSFRDRVCGGVGALSALTDWALETGIVTADSMRARGYGTGKRTNFHLYRLTRRDILVGGLVLALAILVLTMGGTGARFSPRVRLDPVNWGLAGYCVLLAVPSVMHITEVLKWRCLRSGI